MRRRFGFWLVYGLAWIPVATSYRTFYAGHLGQPLDAAITKSVTGVLPADSLGAVIVTICERLAWSRKRRLILLAVHSILAVLFFEFDFRRIGSAECVNAADVLAAPPTDISPDLLPFGAIGVGTYFYQKFA
jgi:hypothetical protein